MKISYNWIREFVDLDVEAAAAAHALTMSGTEIEEIEHQDIPREVICALITEVKPHPNSDKLYLCQVDTGRETLKVVCGAPNTRTGLMSAFAPVGTSLGPDMLVKKAKIRGEESFGILLSERELGLTDDHTGIMELDGNLKPGDVLTDVLKLEDWVLTVNVTPNRGDCLSVIGVARELSALFRADFRMPAFQIREDPEPIENRLTVEIQAPDACPRYSARFLKGVTIGKSPFWMRRRLFQSGVRAISNVVDITNYVMLEYGQPLHAFDATFIAGTGIVVRKAADGESFVTLDSVERKLNRENLLICDKQKPVALAGVMGGENSEVMDTTETVVLESAFFDPVSIQRTSRGLNLSTEASYRFERGIDPSIQVEAADRAAWLMAEHAAAKVLKGVVDVNYYEYARKDLILRKSYLEKVLGIGSIGAADVNRTFSLLGCDVQETVQGWQVTPPVFRHDITREIDLVEEFVRIYGMDKVEPDLPTFKPIRKSADETKVRDLRLALAAMGLSEVITYSFISPRWKKFFPAESLELLNPISDEMKIMRTSLIPGLATAVERNKKLQNRDISVFEIGKSFQPVPDGKLPVEQYCLGIAMSGQRFDTHWSDRPRQVDFYDLKGVAETMLGEPELQPSNHPYYQPGRQADIFTGGRSAGTIGCLHQDILAMLDIADDVFVLELPLEACLNRKRQDMKEIPKFPSTWRDLSLVTDEAVTYRDIAGLVFKQNIKEIRQVFPVDLYLGDKLPQGKKGITIRITYQSDSRTLEDATITVWQEKIIKSLRENLGIELRQ
jgi:phenylalanyl-tRNA synthetase beta chain